MKIYFYSEELGTDYDFFPNKWKILQMVILIYIGDLIIPYLLDPFIISGFRMPYDFIFPISDWYFFFLVFILGWFTLFNYTHEYFLAFFYALFVYVFFFHWFLATLWLGFTKDVMYFIMLFVLISDFLALDSEEEVGIEDIV